MTGSAPGRTGEPRYGEGVSLVAAAVCPHPPLIVPELAGAAAPELDDLRTAADAAVSRLLGARPDCLVVLGTGAVTGWIIPPATGSFRPWGLDLTVPLVPALPDEGKRLPLSVTVGAWLLGRQPVGARAGVRVVGAQVSAEATPAELARLAGQVHEYRPRVALLVMGDGSACRGPKSPGYDDPRAEAYDDGVARALADADADALLGLDPARSAELKAAGRAPWQVLAGAVRTAGGGWRGELRHHSAPYGVAYFVASWEPA
ncbi:class III extradiol dioxygenase subunit B-like domain-containing protein [Micromonospora coerulea]|uniref:class III extradiol dioxygenase subunit B-like domain-containing protein n=1 Tax=Micromonospora coerulea TaxID=47856 RepID=UPI00190717B2|nr:class III extradiol dioxygenase subunit B-like domain-containing protein [Micromonospora veneta]